MKKYFWALIVVCLIAFAWMKIHSKSSQVADSEKVEEPKKTIVKAKEFYDQPVAKLADKKTLSENKDIPAACQNMWHELLEMRMDDIGKEAKAKNSAILDQKCLHDSARMLSLAGQVYARCLQTDLDDEEKIKACQQQLTSYRAQMIYWLTRNETDLSKLDTNILINRTMGLVLTPGTMKNPKEFIDGLETMGVELKTREKDMYAAYKTVAAAKVMRFMYDVDLDPASQAEAKKEALKSVQDAQGFGVDKEELSSLKWMMEIKSQDYPSAQQQIDGFLIEKPNSAKALYDKSAMYWQMGQSIGARKYLDQALALEPGNTDFAATKQKMALAQKKSAIYSFKVNVDFSDN